MLNSITIIGNKEEGTDSKELSDTIPKATIKIDTLGIFKEDKLIGWATKDESKGINLLTNNVENFYVKTKCEDKYMMNYIENIKTKTDIDLENNTVKIDIDGKAKILEVNCKLDLENPNTINEIEKNIKDE